MHQFRDIVRYWSNNADFNLPHLYLAPSLGVYPLEFRQDHWREKATVPWLSCGVVFAILRLAF